MEKDINILENLINHIKFDEPLNYGISLYINSLENLIKLCKKQEEKEFKIITGGRHQGREIENAINLYNSIKKLPYNEVYNIINSKGYINIFKIKEKNNNGK